METFTVHVGRAAALPQPNLDTDTIIRVERMMALARDELGPWCFEVLRYRPDGSPNPDFVLNQPAFEATSIIVGGANFGCGSSREAAVWALRAFGIRCIIAPSFGDIFFNNCFQNAILPIALAPDRVAALQASAAHGIDLEIDLEAQAIRGAGREIPFDVDAVKRRSLLLGLDDIDLTLTMADVLADFERTDQRRRPWIYADPAQAMMKDTE